MAAGCSAITETETVEAADTYQRWSAQMDHIPFLFHLPGGQVEAFDIHGRAWTETGSQAEARDADRVEVYIGSFPGPSASLCEGKPAASALPADTSKANVVSALCDRARTVVSFSDQARPRVLAARPTYIARTRHLLLNGIWRSVAQEPDPKPY
jgi:hypothetical protein